MTRQILDIYGFELIGNRSGQQNKRSSRYLCAALLTACCIFPESISAQTDDCSTASSREKAKLETYLAKELDYDIAKFTALWISEKQTEYSSPELLNAAMAAAENEKLRLELEVEQAETAYHAANATRIAVCPDG